MKRPCSDIEHVNTRNPSISSLSFCTPFDDAGSSELGESMEDSSGQEGVISEREVSDDRDGQEWSIVQNLVSQLRLETLYDTASGLLHQLRLAEGCASREHQHSDENMRAWAVCAIFLASHISGVTIDPILLARLLQSASIQLPQFCLHLRHQVTHVSRRQLPVQFSAGLTAFQTLLVQVIAVFRKYEKLFNVCVKPNLADISSQAFEAGWVLLLCVKAEVEETDLHFLFGLVICVLRLLLTSQGTMDGIEAMSLIQTLDPSLSDKAFAARVMSIQQQFKILINNLKVAQVLSYEHPAAEDVFHSSHLASNQYNLNVSYESKLVQLAANQSHHSFQLDERVFISPFPLPVRSLRLPWEENTPPQQPAVRKVPLPSLSSFKRSFYEPVNESHPRACTSLSSYSPPCSSSTSCPPSSSPSFAASTTSPLWRLLETVAWLGIKCVTVGPSENLKQLLGPELTAAIMANVRKQEQHLVFGPAEFQQMNEGEVTVKLYYYLLEKMVVAEHQRSSVLIRRPWVKSTCFHNCLLACCFEIIIFAFKKSGLKFPAVLRMFGVTAWDFFKVVESAVRHGDFPRPAKAHLRDVEFMILEKLAWLQTEKLPLILRSNEAKEFLKQQYFSSSTPSASPMFPPGLKSPPLVPLILPPAHSDEPSEQAPPLSSGDRFSLSLFTRKLMALAADRLEYLCSESLLKVSPDLLNLVWALLHHVLTEQPDMLINRHLDTLILCSIYAVCSKIAKLDLKFRRIIAVYVSRWEHNCQQVTRSVYTKANENPLNIIEFYNNYFIHQTKVYILKEIKPAYVQSMPQISPVSSPTLAATSRWANGYTSPLQEHRITQANGTPKPRKLFAFTEASNMEDSEATESDGSDLEPQASPPLSSRRLARPSERKRARMLPSRALAEL